MSNSSRSRWKLAEQTVIRVRINLAQQTQPSHTTSMAQRQETDRGIAWIPNTPGNLKAECDIQQLTPTPENNTQGLEEQMHYSYVVSQRCPQI